MRSSRHHQLRRAAWHPPSLRGLRRALLGLVVVWAGTSLEARANDGGEARGAGPKGHELGWLCVPVSDTRISQVAAFNRDARMLMVTVPKRRFYIEAATDGQGGRVCIPTIVRVGQVAIPDETLIFERTLHVGNVAQSSQAELVLTPEDPNLDEVTLDVVGLADQWTERDGVATFSVVTPVTFPARKLSAFIGEGGILLRALCARGGRRDGRREFRRVRCARRTCRRPRRRAPPPRGRDPPLALRRPRPRYPHDGRRDPIRRRR